MFVVRKERWKKGEVKRQAIIKRKIGKYVGRRKRKYVIDTKLGNEVERK